MPGPGEYDPEVPDGAQLHRIAQELGTMRKLLVEVLNKLIDAEKEIPERVRRFTDYFHSVHSVHYMYEERGLPVPSWIRDEMERCDDRFRHLLQDEHASGATFEKVRREMASREGNRWDHTKALFGPKENGHEAGSSLPLFDGIDKG